MDVEGPWHTIAFGEDSWDLIHMRAMNGSIRSWSELYPKILRYVWFGCRPTGDGGMLTRTDT